MKHRKQIYTLFTFILLVLIVSTQTFAAEAPVQFSAEPFVSTSQDNAIVIKLHIAPDSEYHFYSRKKGETGKPTSISVSPAPEGSTVRYPAGKKKNDPLLKDKITYLYEGAEDIYITIPDATSGKTTIEASILLCSDVRCTPVRKTISVTWDTGSLKKAESMDWWQRYSDITPEHPDTSKLGSSSSGNSKELAKKLSVQLPSSSGSSGTLSLSSSGKATSSLLKQATPQEHTYSFTPRYFIQVLEVGTLSKAIIFGLIAGFILNFMPCVLPVISLKLSSLVAAAQIADEKQRKRIFRNHNIFFAFGILTWFFLLTVVLTSFELAWGQMFQNENLLMGLAILIFLLALSIFDIFPLPMFSLTGRGTENGNDKWSAFSTGLLATLLATPCSGPLLGGVLGWAFLQPVGVLILIFLSVGLGMALPYFAMALVPDLVTRFPRPGAWTATLSKVVGFFLLGTVVYLLYILPAKVLPDMLIVLWVTAVAAWAWGHFSGLAYTRTRNILVRSCCALLVVVTIFVAFKEEPKAKQWHAFTPETFFAGLQQKRMVVDFSADWCPTCKFLERSVLTAENRAKWENKYNVEFVKVDLTTEDMEKQKFLESLGASSIPIVAIFPTGEKASSPIILRDLFTTGQMENALKEAFSK
ncbi:protein-disulfide reductase DsbD family protein [Halodesulfovibrio spirochaetisodalis]|uniref:Thioredoxin domain-containing protein n=1 Tax=Halodesulfovibrio spirochaetisodalis TaxID=1560234 RepID=A0A1B7X9X3_9BACT|nr:cytochrome c biogenesis protein CcdA [Halodesulfovibrio spirochaetisodalis]OBQ46171.1 hypothetical protein SP90_13820 [Halodesulfovibrio spirochaetisodalis]